LTWKESLHQTKYRGLLLYITVTGILLLAFLPSFFSYINNKPGTIINDALLDVLPAIDVSIPIFLIIYLVIIATIVSHYRSPKIIVSALSTYCTVTLFRIATIYLFTLEPPTNWVILQDPLVSKVAYDGTFAKDLFFSGHISTLCVTIFTEPKVRWRWIKIGATFIVAVLLLVQHIHYTIDVLAAPVFTYISFLLVNNILKK
jgi:hypothetical protein